MRTDSDREAEVAARRDEVVYDTGPSGTAVAGLIISLIALAVGLYAAFAPRETVRSGAQAVETGWEQTVEPERGVTTESDRSTAGQPAEPEATRRAEGGEQPTWTERAGEEFQEELTALQRELQDLRARMDSWDENRSETPASSREPAPANR
jgi:hypothetical protein